MTSSTGVVAHTRPPGSARRAARSAAEARRQRHVIRFLMLAAMASLAVDKRTVQGAIVLVIGVAAAARLAKDRGAPGLDWYWKHAVQKASPKKASPKKASDT